MTTFVKPSTGRLRSVVLAGCPISDYVHCVRVFETLCKPYLTAHLIVIDNNNLIDSLGIMGGTPCTLSFDSPPGDVVYDDDFLVLQLTGKQSPMNLKTQIYDIDLIGMPYFRDKANLVQKSFGQIPVTAAIQQIWDEYLSGSKGTKLSIPIASTNMMGTEKDKSTIDHKKPFAAIDQLRGYCVFPSKSPSVLFRDNRETWLWPFKDLVKLASPIVNYIQKETWGAELFGGKDIYFAIIYAEADVDKNFNGEGLGGRGGSSSAAKTVSQGQAVFDMFKGFPEKFTAAASMFGGGLAAGMAAGGLGGSPNVQHTNSNRWQNAVAPFTKAMSEQGQAAEAKNGPQLKIKVPLQTGLLATVGKGVSVSLIGAVGDNFTSYAQNPMSGVWLVKDIAHELWTDKREVNGTTVMQLIRGPSESVGGFG